MSFWSDPGGSISHALGDNALNAINPTTWSVGGNSISNTSIGGSKIGPYLNPFSMKSRDLGQTAGTLYADYYTGGLASLANGWQSKGSQAQLNSPVGKVAQVAAAGAGAYNGAPQQLYGNISDYATGANTGTMTADQFSAAGDGTGTGGYSPASSNFGVGTGAGTTSSADATSMGVGTQAGDAAATSAGTDAASTAATKAGMSMSQKIALGLAGFNALGGMMNKPKPISTDPNGVGANASATASALLNNFNKGQLQPTDQYNIAKWQQDQLASSKDYYDKAGLSDSSMATEAAAGVAQQAEAMRGQALTNMMNNGLSAAGVANTYTQQQVQLQVAQDQQLQQSQSNFMQTLAMYGMTAA